MLDPSTLRLTEEEIDTLYDNSDTNVTDDNVAEAQLVKALEGVRVWLESYEDPLIKGMGQWLREHLAAGID